MSRIMDMPHEPLPDLDSLKKDFDTCVLEKDPECTYIEGSSALGFGDHRRCGALVKSISCIGL